MRHVKNSLSAACIGAVCSFLLFGNLACERQSVGEPTPVSAAGDGGKTKETPSDRDLLDTAKSLFDRAKQEGTTRTSSAKQWLSETIDKSVNSGEATAEQTAEWITEQFHQAKQAGETSATNTKDWVLQDIKKLGAWEYKHLTVSKVDSPESHIKQMNELGAERWECFHHHVQGDLATYYFKRPARSYLKQIPARDLLRLVPLLNSGGGPE